MSRGIVICLCDLTGKFAEPWVAAGYDVVLVDPQHPTGTTVETRPNGATITRIGCTIIEAMSILSPIILSGRVVFVAGFPPCTDVSLSGTKHWARKRDADPYFQAKAAIVAEQCRMIGMACGCRWFFENPKSAFTSIFGPPQHKFQPWHFTWHCEDDCYTKETWLWTGGGFTMPDLAMDPAVATAVDLVVRTVGRFVAKPKVLELEWDARERSLIETHYPDDRIHKAPPNDERANFRSATPTGFSVGVFMANAPHLQPANDNRPATAEAVA